MGMADAVTRRRGDAEKELEGASGRVGETELVSRYLGIEVSR